MNVLVLVLALADVTGSTGDPRTLELVRRSCESSIDRREVTLFANGTVRLRTWQGGEEPELQLGELGPGELDAFRRRLEDLALDEAESPSQEVRGDWVAGCDITLRRDGKLLRYRYGPFDTLALGLSALRRVVDDLEDQVEPLAGPGFPAAYEARPGDVVERSDGELFEVVALTSDGLGAELVGIDIPLTIFLPKGQLRSQFRRLVERAP